MSHENLPPIPDPQQNALDQARQIIDNAGPYEVAQNERSMGETQGALDTATRNVASEPNDALVEARDIVDTAFAEIVVESAAANMSKIVALEAEPASLFDQMKAKRQEQAGARATERLRNPSSSVLGKGASAFKSNVSRRHRPR